MIDRKQFLELYRSSIASGERGYARSIATDWLATWPGDQGLRTFLAELEHSMKLTGTAIARLEEVVLADPESQPAYQALADILEQNGDPARAAVYRACATSLNSAVPAGPPNGPSWQAPLQGAIQALKQGKPEAALAEIQTVLACDLGLPLPLLIAAKIHIARGDDRSAASIARLGHDRWPETVAFNLMIALAALNASDGERGLAALHRAAAQDPTGEIAARFLGDSHPYRSIWPEKLEMKILRPIPERTSKAIGKTLSEQADPVPDSRVPTGSVPAPALQEQERAIQDDFEDEAMPQPEPWEAYDGPDPGEDLAPQPPRSADSVAFQDSLQRMSARYNLPRPTDNRDARRPAYLIMSSRSRLMQVFGEAAFDRIDEAARKLAAAVRGRQGWQAHLVYVDDPGSMKSFGLSPVDPTNAWQIKLRLADLDQALSSRGEMIGALYILGGHQIIPFHMLPNPTDDVDEEVPSDNPYATTDENYFAPEWPVGRAPSDGNSNLIVKMLQQAAQDHQAGGRAGLSPTERARLWLANRLGGLFRVSPHSIGYSASIWKKASLSVFRSIGEPRSMLTSPPVEAAALPPIALRPSVLSYFNLHGLQDAPEWYGQRDPVRDRKVKVEFPVALRTEDVVNGGRAPKIVFTEACYGAHVLDKEIDSAMALKFLDSGSHAVVGSTKISYGSITPPLIAADLLGRLFWGNLNRLLPAGEALRRAKLQLATEMHRRQGYLDGEDQKTIISFVLYGDPLYSVPFAPRQPGRKTIVRSTERPKTMKTACAKGGALQQDDLDPQAKARVEEIVARYLPGMSGAACRIRDQHQGCQGDDHVCPSNQVGMKGLPQSGMQTRVISLSKRIPYQGVEHPHFARVTLDHAGRILKLAVSR